MSFTPMTLRRLLLAVLVTGCAPAGLAGIPCPSTPAASGSAPTTLRQTGRVFDLAIKGDGYFVIRDWQTGRNVYTRYGQFRLSPEGTVFTTDGRYVIEPQLTVPTDAVETTFTPDGLLKVKSACSTASGSDSCGSLKAVGQINLARFTNPGGLQAVTPTIVAETCTSGPPLLQPPGQNGAGSLVVGSLEVTAPASDTRAQAP